jgi:hypothetical protein
MTVWPGQPPGHGAILSEGIEGDEWGAYVTLETYDEAERGITCRGASPEVTETS